MRRWNGWGEQDTDSPLDPLALAFLRERTEHSLYSLPFFSQSIGRE